jgi:hypothetical protein
MFAGEIAAKHGNLQQVRACAGGRLVKKHFVVQLSGS